MKKLLLSSAAVCGLALVPATAQAQLSLNLGGYANIYGVYVDQDESSAAAIAVDGTEAREFDMLRETEIQASGETTLDNGITVGAHIELEADGEDGAGVQESYLFFSGEWGRINAGTEDGAVYLLQVATPSADSNYDGLRQYVQPFNYAVMAGAATGLTAPFAGMTEADGLDYDQDLAVGTDNLTYLSPVFNGFQLGVTYVPDFSDNGGSAFDLDGVRTDNTLSFGSLYEFGARYEGMFNNIGVILGGGYTHLERERVAAVITPGLVSDDRTVWNGGIDLDIGPFGFGVSYSEDDHGDVRNALDDGSIGEEEILVIGADYTTGPFKFGASYLDSDNSFGIEMLESTRYTGGVEYTYGPGMSFRGSITHVEHDKVTGLPATEGDKVDGTAVLFGTHVDF